MVNLLNKVVRQAGSTHPCAFVIYSGLTVHANNGDVPENCSIWCDDSRAITAQHASPLRKNTLGTRTHSYNHAMVLAKAQQQAGG